MFVLINRLLTSCLLVVSLFSGSLVHSTGHFDHDISIHSRKALTSFPSYYYGAVHPGMWILPWNKNDAYKIYDQILDQFLLDHDRLPIDDDAYELELKLLKEVIKQGIIGIDSDPEIAHPHHRGDFQVTLKFVEENYLNKALRELTEIQLSRMILETNGKLWEAFARAYGKAAGKYRQNGLSMVNKIYSNGDKQPWSDDQKAEKLYDSVITKIGQYEGYHVG